MINTDKNMRTQKLPTREITDTPSRGMSKDWVGTPAVGIKTLQKTCASEARAHIVHLAGIYFAMHTSGLNYALEQPRPSIFNALQVLDLIAPVGILISMIPSLRPSTLIGE